MSLDCDDEKQDKIDEGRDFIMMGEIYGIAEQGYNETKAGHDWLAGELFKNAAEMTESERAEVLDDLHSFHDDLQAQQQRLDELGALRDTEYQEYLDAKEKEKECLHNLTEVSMKLKEVE